MSTPDILCKECSGKCCGNDKDVQINLTLTDSERRFLLRSGTRLQTQIAPKSHPQRVWHCESKKPGLLPSNHGVYRFEGPCGYAQETGTGMVMCNEHKNPLRPDACQTLRIGGFHCNEIRG